MGRSLVNPDNNNFAPAARTVVQPHGPLDHPRRRLACSMCRTRQPRVRHGPQSGRPRLIRYQHRAAKCNPRDPWALEAPAVYMHRIYRNLSWRAADPRQYSRTCARLTWISGCSTFSASSRRIWCWKLGYLGNEGHKLDRFRLYNQPMLKSGPTDTRSVAQRTPWPAYGRIQEVDGSDNSNYNASEREVDATIQQGTHLHGRLHLVEGDRRRQRACAPTPATPSGQRTATILRRSAVFRSSICPAASSLHTFTNCRLDRGKRLGK